MNLEASVERLEKATGLRNRACTCSRSFQGISPRVVVYYPEEGDDKPSTACEDCGGQMALIRVVYETSDFRNYHA